MYGASVGCRCFRLPVAVAVAALLVSTVTLAAVQSAGIWDEEDHLTYPADSLPVPGPDHMPIDPSHVQNLQPHTAFLQVAPFRDIEESVVRKDAFCQVSFRTSGGDMQIWRLKLFPRRTGVGSAETAWVCVFAPLSDPLPSVRFLAVSMDVYTLVAGNRVTIRNQDVLGREGPMTPGIDYVVNQEDGEVSSLPSWDGDLARMRVEFTLQKLAI